MRKALLISDSPELVETIDILLGGRFALEAVAGQGAPAAIPDSVALLIVDAATTGSVPVGEAPVIWIGDLGRMPPHVAAARRRVLPRHFEAFAFLAAVDELSGAPAPSVARPLPDILRYPYLPDELAPVALRAVGSELPVVVSGEPGTGKARVARAIHAERGGAYLLALSTDEANRRNVDALPSQLHAGDQITIVIDDLAQLAASGQRFLLDLLEGAELVSRGGIRLRVRVIATASQEIAALLRAGTIPKSLFYRLNVLALPLPPLRLRSADIPALISAVSGALCRSLGIPPVIFTEASVRRMSRYLWFGNLAELEAVVARSIAFRSGSTLDAGDLLFGYGPLVPRVVAATVPAAVTPPPPPRQHAAANGALSNAATVDLIINELAHEFKNPLVTIKTFAHQFDQLMSRESGNEQLVRLTGEAIERMDDALENLVQFTRFHQPAPQPTPLAGLVTAAIRGIEEAIAEKQLALSVEPTATHVLVDPAQLGYALKNLLRTVVRDLASGEPLSLRAPAPGVLELEYPASARSAARTLAKLLASENGKEALPLGFAFAKSLIERNGGHVTIHRGPDPARVTIDLPPVGEMN